MGEPSPHIVGVVALIGLSTSELSSTLEVVVMGDTGSGIVRRRPQIMEALPNLPFSPDDVVALIG